MRLIRNFVTRLDVYDMKDIYSDLDELTMRLLTEKFVNRCFKSSFIIRIVSIIKRSVCALSTTTLVGNGYMNVMFEAEVLVFSPSEIVTGCVVQNIDKVGRITCLSTDNTIAVYIKEDPRLRSIKVGQFLPIRVGRVKYKTGTTAISINAVPYIATPPKLIIYNIKPLTREDAEYLQEILNQVNEEEARHTGINKKIRDYFKGIIGCQRDLSDQSIRNIKIGNYDNQDDNEGNLHDSAEHGGGIVMGTTEYGNVIGGIGGVIVGNNDNPNDPNNLNDPNNPNNPNNRINLMGSKKIDLKTLNVSGIITSTHSSLNPTEPFILQLPAMPNNVEVIEENSRVVITQMLVDYLNNLITLREFCTIYHNDQLITSHSNIFALSAQNAPRFVR